MLNISRYQFQESKLDKFILPVHSNKAVLEKYANVYVKEFSLLYNNEHLVVEIFPLEHFIAMNFSFCKSRTEGSENIIFRSEKNDEAAILKRLANNLSISQITNTQDPTKNLFIQKDIKGFEENSFYVIKPNEYKCWHPAIAWYDVAEFKEVIETAELQRLRKDIDVF